MNEEELKTYLSHHMGDLLAGSDFWKKFFNDWMQCHAEITGALAAAIEERLRGGTRSIGEYLEDVAEDRNRNAYTKRLARDAALFISRAAPEDPYL